MSERGGEAAARPAALVTGGRRGIGRGIVLALAREGFDIAINDVEQDAAAERTLAEARALGVTSAMVVGDISDADAHRRIVDDAEGALERGISCLVNNAGISQPRLDLFEHAVESFDRVMAVNLRGPFFLSIEVARRMAAHRGDTRHRSIIFISSVNAVFASPDRGAYCLSKAGLSMATRLFAARLGHEGIATYEIRPGMIETDMTAPVRERYRGYIEGGMALQRRWGQPEDLGRAVAVLASGRLPYATGDTYYVDGGMHVQRL